MNAEEAARTLYPPEDGPYPGVDRNEHARYAFLRGVEWQTGALLAHVEQIPPPVEPLTKDQILEHYANSFCEGGRYRDIRIMVDELWDDAVSHTMAVIRPVIQQAAGRATVRQELVEQAKEQVMKERAHPVTVASLLAAIDKAIDEPITE